MFIQECSRFTIFQKFRFSNFGLFRAHDLRKLTKSQFYIYSGPISNIPDRSDSNKSH